jgi:hypothetical protein
VNPVSNTVWQEPFERDGFAIIESILTLDRVAELIDVCYRSGKESQSRSFGESHLGRLFPCLDLPGS